MTLTAASSFYSLTNGYDAAGVYLIELKNAQQNGIIPEQTVNVAHGYYFGSTSIPYRIVPTNDAVTSAFSDFLLINSEIKYSGRLKFIQFYGTQNGLIEIDVR